MKRTIFGAGLCVVAMQAMAQETYESAALATEDLNGTARYVGMGGAMEALGADISTISSNPAGIGMFRRSWVGASGGLTAQQGDDFSQMGNLNVFDNKSGRTNADLNQLGFVYSIKSRENRYFNIGFNYHKHRNFNHVLNASGASDGASMGAMWYIEDVWAENLAIDYAPAGTTTTRLQEMIDYATEHSTSALHGVNKELQGQSLDGGYSMARGYQAQKAARGFISDFDLSFSGNINNRIFLGATVGFKDVHYKQVTTYGEMLATTAGADRGEASYEDNRNITGTGFDIKFGAIFVPSEASPFRVGVYVHTPTWYDLNVEQSLVGYTSLAEDNYTNYMVRYSADWDYKISTPWKFGLSLGHTVGKTVALGATYEYADYTFTKNKLLAGTYYEYDPYWDDYYTQNEYENDVQMNRHTKETLKATHTLKLGAEIKPVPELAIRVGYNYVSPMYKTEAQKDYTIDGEISPGKYNATYDFINWKATNRVTFGLGFSLNKNWTLDMAYQFTTQKGDYHTFADGSYQWYDDNNQLQTTYNYGNVKEVKNNRHQLNMTLGYRF